MNLSIGLPNKALDNAYLRQSLKREQIMSFKIYSDKTFTCLNLHSLRNEGFKFDDPKFDYRLDFIETHELMQEFHKATVH